MNTKPVYSKTCGDGASQHCFEIRDIVGRQGPNHIIVEWMCVDCDVSFTELKRIEPDEELV